MKGRDPREEQALRQQLAHDARRNGQGDPVAERQGDGVAGPLRSHGLGHPQWLSRLVHVAKLELDQERCQYSVVEEIERRCR